MPFFAAARADEERIRAAARAVNRGIGSTTILLDREALDAIRASAPRETALAIPAGMDPDLLLAVLRVYSDLDARSAAFNPGQEIIGRALPLTDQTSVRLLGALRDGSVIARRYPGDVAAARALATARPPTRLAAPDSRQAAELALHVAVVNEANRGCDSSGGHVYTSLAPIVWRTTVTDYGRFDGTVAGIAFRATYRSGSGWNVQLNAC